MICERCGDLTNSWRTSWFNTEQICDVCQTNEEGHSKFAEAKRTEEEEVMKGNYNFPGVGLPPELRT